MTLTKSVQAIIILLIAVFLTTLGMRLSFLDKDSGPKPRPRAVLKTFVKSAGGACKSEIASKHVMRSASFEWRYLLPTGAIAYIVIQANAAPSDPLLTVSDRSPPLC